MKNSIKIILVVSICLFQVCLTKAQLTLPSVISSNMVLQRNTQVEIWGWSAAGKDISIRTSWSKKIFETKSDASGKWQTQIPTTMEKGPHSMTISTKTEKVTLENILFGEVWICSGQSNMQQPVKGFRGQPTYGSAEAIKNGKNSNIRLFMVEINGSKEPLDQPVKFRPWTEATPASVADITAVGYFFGKDLNEILDVPVGIIMTARGASSVQTWMSKQVLEKYQQFDISDETVTNENNTRLPTVLFNAMLNPLIPYTFKGVLWYQGEANRSNPEQYKELFPAMVKDWRERWGQGDFPFYFVQIAPFNYGGNEKKGISDNSAFMREAQEECVGLIPNSGIAITVDIGAQSFIHPPRKKEVADRLLLLALEKTYGVDGIDSEGPRYSTHEEKEGGLLLSFEEAELGLYAVGELKGFEIAGEDQVFYPAEAVIFNQAQVLVKSEKVAKPVAVRYAWNNWTEASLFDTNLLPVSSFRTDDWE